MFQFSVNVPICMFDDEINQRDQRISDLYRSFEASNSKRHEHCRETHMAVNNHTDICSSTYSSKSLTCPTKNSACSLWTGGESGQQFGETGKLNPVV